MDVPIEFEFKLSAQDYKRAVRDFYLRQRSIQAMILLAEISGILGLLVASIFREGIGEPFFTMLLIGCVFFVVGFPLIVAFYLPYQVERRVSQNERARALQRWKLTEDGVELRTEYNESKSDWNVFGRIIESKDYYLLALSGSKSLFMIVPKRAFRTRQMEEEFREIVMRKVGEA